jgi:D-alanyl-lipoteichoic acid acyltransferase DltB (MBOAT superfamily)
MLFNSFEFLLFFPVVTVLYFLLPHRFRWLHLLIASCVFYCAFIPVYILILLLTIIIDYIAGIMIENAEGNKRKLFLAASIIANVGVLAIFKYFNFFTTNINELLHISNTAGSFPVLDIILPIGLSFHTFQAMSYTIEVYRGHQKAERNLGIYSLYVMFYPQLVAGPIERPQNLLPQFHEEKFFDYRNATRGLELMLWGMFKKVVIADRLALITDPIFNTPHQYSPIVLAMGAFFFAFQIFCDFSGYSDIAIGAARVMGFKLMTNFNRPYHSKNVSEFWKRWHISLSTWFKDYLYISLGGNRVSVPRWYFNLFFVFLVSGFWHGANWTFILWGALHGFYLVFAIIIEKPADKFNTLIGIKKVKWLYKSTQILSTFILVVLAWIFFRANNISDAFYILQQMPHAAIDLLQGMFSLSLRPGKLPIGKTVIYISLALIFLLEFVHYIQRHNRIPEFLQKQSVYIRWGIYYILILSIIFGGVFENRQFIYFQF